MGPKSLKTPILGAWIASVSSDLKAPYKYVIIIITIILLLLLFFLYIIIVISSQICEQFK